MNFDCRFLIHGWGGDGESFFNEDATDAYLTHSDFNVIRFDLIAFTLPFAFSS
jgi:pimeloyl-ACP methyl ester carboxylesterase